MNVLAFSWLICAHLPMCTKRLLMPLTPRAVGQLMDEAAVGDLDLLTSAGIDWQSRERIRKQKDRVRYSTYQTSQTLQTVWELWAKRRQSHWGVLQRAWGQGSRMEDEETRGGWLIEIVVWKDGAIKGFAFAGWKCVTCWVISQYGFCFNKPPRSHTNTANETHVFTTHTCVTLSSKCCRRSCLLSPLVDLCFPVADHRKRILHSPRKHNGVKPATSPHLQPPPARRVWSSIQNQRKNYMVTLDGTSVVNQNGFSKFLFFMQRIPVLALTADIFKPRKPKQTFAVPGPGQQCSQSWRKWEDRI